MQNSQKQLAFKQTDKQLTKVKFHSAAVALLHYVYKLLQSKNARKGGRWKVADGAQLRYDESISGVALSAYIKLF